MTDVEALASGIDLTRAMEVAVDAYIETLPPDSLLLSDTQVAMTRLTIGEYLLPIVTALVKFFEDEANR